MYPTLDFAKFTSTTLDINDTLAVAVLENSKGLPTMSDSDVKIALVSLINTCARQQAVIDQLVDCVNEMRAPKKKRIRIPFKK